MCGVFPGDPVVSARQRLNEIEDMAPIEWLARPNWEGLDLQALSVGVQVAAQRAGADWGRKFLSCFAAGGLQAYSSQL